MASGGGGVGAGEGMGSMMATDQLSFGRIRLLGLKIFFFFDQNSLYKLNMHACLQAIALPHAKMQVVRPPTYENQF